MKGTLIHLCSLVEYPIFGLEADFHVDIPSKTGVKCVKYGVGRCMYPQVNMNIYL